MTDVSPEKLQDTIVDLQTRSAYQEDAINELSDLIYQQQQQIDTLSRKLEQLTQTIEQLCQGSAETDAEPTLPPHF